MFLFDFYPENSFELLKNWHVLSVGTFERGKQNQTANFDGKMKILFFHLKKLLSSMFELIGSLAY